MQFIHVNVQLWWNSRFLKMSFWKLVGHQISSVAVLGGMARTAAAVAAQVVGGVAWTFLLSGIIYSLGCMAILLLAPSVFSLTRMELQEQFRRVLSFLKG